MRVKMKNETRGKTRTARKKKYGKGHWELTLMAFPALLFIFIFAYLPMCGLIIAFKNYKFNLGIWGSEWCGFENFEFLIKSETFTTILRNTVGYNIVFIILGAVLAISLALLLDIISNKISIKIFQSSMFLPYFLSWVVVSYISHCFLSNDTGVINSMLARMGLDRISFYSETKYWPYILTFFNQWKGIGFSTLVYYGSILSIDQSLYEAAAIDGCSTFKQIRYITLPHLKSTVIILMLLSVGRIFYSDYGLFFYIPKDTGALYGVTDVIDTYILRLIRTTGDLGSSSAASFLQSVVGFLVVVTANYIANKFDSESSLF